MKHSIFEIIEFSLPLPIQKGFVHELSEGVDVKRDGVIAVKKDLRKEIIDLNIKFKLEKKDKSFFVRVAPGDRCTKGMVLAEKNTLMSKMKVLCPFDALVVSVDDNKIEIVEFEDKLEVVSPIRGKIGGTSSDQVVVATDALQYSFGYSAGNATWGELKICYGRGEGSDWMDVSLENKVILVEELTGVIWHKANALGVKGIIAGQAPSVYEQWIDTKRDDAGLLVHDGDQDKWEMLVEQLEDYQGNVVFVVPQEKLMVIAK